MESLEIRRLFQSCSVSGGLMTVIGNETNDDITIAEDASHRMLIRNHGVEINHAQCYVLDTLNKINVTLGDGNDIGTILASVSPSIQISLNGGVQDDTLNGGAGNDLLMGTAGNDILFGGAGDDTLDGGSNTDILNGGPGADQLLGGIGGPWPDTADYSDRLDDLSLTVNGVADDGAAGEGDFIDVTILVILAGNGNDRIVSRPDFESIVRGNGGDDTIVGGDAADTLDGGGGIDWLDYGYRTGPLKIDLTSGIPNNGTPSFEGDLLLGFENVIGGHGPDTITGTDGFNIIYGGEGNDVINGNGDNDQIDAQAGDDTVILKTNLPIYPLIEGGADYDILDMVGASYAFADDASAHGLEQINLSQLSTLTFAATQHLSALNIQDESQVVLEPDGLRLLHVNSLSLSADSTLHLGNNGMIVDHGNLATIADLIRTGLTSATGIRSQISANRRLGVIANTGPLYSTFLGEPKLSGNETLVLYTLIGDLNLDRQVTISDFIDLAAHFGQSPATWGDGDINYDGAVTISDFIDLSANFGQVWSGSIRSAHARFQRKSD